MSDIGKAEELLKRTRTFLSNHEAGGGYLTPTEEAILGEIREYFRKPVIIRDWNDEPVRIYVDTDKDVSFEWGDGDGTPNIVAFKPEELVRGLREIGVIK